MRYHNQKPKTHGSSNTSVAFLHVAPHGMKKGTTVYAVRVCDFRHMYALRTGTPGRFAGESNGGWLKVEVHNVSMLYEESRQEIGDL